MDNIQVKMSITSLFFILFISIIGMLACEYLDLFCKKYEAGEKDEEN
jgi:hypothetical protein